VLSTAATAAGIKVPKLNPAKFSMNCAKNYRFSWEYAYGPEKAFDGDVMTFAYGTDNKCENNEGNEIKWMIIDLPKKTPVQKVVLVNRFWEQQSALGSFCGTSQEKFQEKGCVGSIDGLKVEVRGSCGAYVECGTVKGNNGLTVEEQTYVVDCGGVEGTQVKLSQMWHLALSEVSIYPTEEGYKKEVDDLCAARAEYQRVFNVDTSKECLGLCK